MLTASVDQLLATLTFQDELDLYFIFLVCYAIQSDPQAVRYTLWQFNCYFFSWTIILNIARNSVTWEGLPTFASFKSLPDSITSELSEMLVRKLLGQSTTMCNYLVHEVLAQLADLLPSRLSVRLPHLSKSLQSLPHLLRSAGDSHNPTSMARWKYLKIKMFYSLEYTLTHDVIRRKLHKHIRGSIQFSGRPGDPLSDVLNHVLRRTLWRRSLSRVVRKATTRFLRHEDPDEGSFPSIDSVMWDSVAEIISREAIYTFQDNVLGIFVDLVHRVVTSCVKQSGTAAAPDTKASLDSISQVVQDTIDASMSDVLKESLSNVVWEAAGRGKEINKAIARAMGSVVADILQDSQLPFALKVRNPWSIKDPALLKSEIHWHVARWAKKATTGVDVQVSHTMLEQYFDYRIMAHSRGVRRLDVVKGHTVHTKKELRNAMQRVWEVVSGISDADGNSEEESQSMSDMDDSADEGSRSPSASF
ncbi:hypothetical protein FRC08_002982 [Ceratobasidium sp. 394]|nr:hypothetical protein FRC08_002982 [Ceratobasidium sp. 394]